MQTMFVHVHAYNARFTDGSTNGMDYMVTPFHSYIVVSNMFVPRLVTYLLYLHLMAAYTFSQATTFVLAKIFSYRFRKISCDLECYL